MDDHTEKLVSKEQDNVFQPIVRAVSRAMNLPAAVWILDEEGQRLRIAAGVGLRPEYVRTAFLALDGPSVTGESFKSGEVTAVRHIPSDPRWKYKQEAETMGWMSVLCVPIDVHDRIMGVISIYTFVERNFSDSEKQLLTHYARQISLTLEGDRRQRILGRLLQTGQAIERLITKQPQEVLQEIVEEACHVVGADCAVIYPYDAVREVFYDVDSVVDYGLNHPLEIKDKPRKTGMGAYIVRREEIVRSSIAEEDPDMLKSPFIAREGIKAFMGIALQTADRVLGILYVNFRQVHDFTDEEQGIIRLFAHQASLAIDNSRLFQQAGSRAEALKRLHESVTEMVSLTGEPESLRTILTRIALNTQQVLGADLVDLYYYSREQGGFVLPPVQLGERYTPEVSKDRIYEDDVVLAILKDPRPRYFEDAQVSPDLTQSFTADRDDAPPARFVIREQVKSAAAVPLVAGDEVAGVIFANYRSSQTFPQQQRELIELFANQAAVAIRTAELYEEVQASLRQRVGDIEALQKIYSLIGTVSLDGLLEEIAEQAARLTPAKYTSVWLLDERARELRFGAVNRREEMPIQPPSRLSLDETSINAYIAARRQAYLCPNVKDDPYYREWHKDVQSELSAPLLYAGKVIGTLNLESTELAAFDADHVRLVEALSGAAAVAIHSARLVTRLDALVSVSKTATSTLDLDKVLDDILDESLDVLGANYGTLRLLDRVSGELNLEAHRGEAGERTLESIPLGKGIVGWVAEHGESLLVPDVLEDDRYLEYVAGTRCELAVPIKAAHDLIGVLNVEHPQPRFFDEHDMHLLEAIAAQVAVSIRNAQSYEREVKRVQMLRALGRLGQELTSGIRLQEDEVMELIHAQATELMDTSNMYIALYEETTDTVRFPLAFVDGERVNVETRKAGKGRTEQIIRTGEPLFHPTADEGKKWYDEPGHDEYIGEPLASWLGVPMKVGERVLGVIATYHPTQDYVYSQDDLEILRAMANQAAVALDNAKLFYGVNRRLEALVKAGRALTSGIRLQEDEVMELIHAQATELMDTSNMYVALYDEMTDTVQFPLAFVDGKRVDVKTRKAGKGATEHIIGTGEPLFHRTAHEAEQWYAEPGHEEYVGTISHSWLGVPMMVGERVLGVIATYHPTQDYVYGPDDLEILQGLASQTAIALDNARLHYDVNQRLERSIQEITALREIEGAIAATVRDPDLDAVLQSILERCVGVTEASAGNFMWRDPTSGRLEARAAVNMPPGWQDLSQNHDEGVVGLAAQKRKSILVEDTKSEEWAGTYIGLIPSMRSELAVPVHGERLFGVINVEHVEPGKFDDEDRALLEAAATQAVIAVRNSETYQAMRQAERNAAAERTWATLGRVAAGVAHRIGNKAGVVRIKIGDLYNMVPDKPLVIGHLETMERNNQYLLNLADLLLKPVKAAEAEREPLDINLIVEDAIENCEIPAEVNVTADLAEDLPKVEANNWFVEVFVELITNALRAMGKSSGKALQLSSRLASDDWVEVLVKDTGCGIQPESREKIFELFSVVGEDEEGESSADRQGFGLWWIRTFFADIGAQIELLESQVDKGSTFVVRLRSIEVE